MRGALVYSLKRILIVSNNEFFRPYKTEGVYSRRIDSAEEIKAQAAAIQRMAGSASRSINRGFFLEIPVALHASWKTVVCKLVSVGNGCVLTNDLRLDNRGTPVDHNGGRRQGNCRWEITEPHRKTNRHTHAAILDECRLKIHEKKPCTLVGYSPVNNAAIATNNADTGIEARIG